MKTSTEHLPPCCREELRVLRSLTVRHIPDCRLIILGGSHAGQDYVSWSESVVRGRHTLYRHDYEIAVFVKGNRTSDTFNFDIVKNSFQSGTIIAIGLFKGFIRNQVSIICKSRISRRSRAIFRLKILNKRGSL